MLASCNPILPLDFLPATPYAIKYAIKNGIVLDDSIDLTGYAAMTQLFLLSILILSSEPVFAGWVAVEKQYQTAGLETVYFDPETIHRNGTRATLWQLTDLKWNSTTRFLSSKTHKEFDCEQSRVRVRQVIEFSRQMGAGRSAAGFIENGSWQSVGAHRLSRVRLQIACEKH